MKEMKYFLLKPVLCLSLLSFAVVVAQGQEQARAQTSRLVVSFYSICCGIDQQAQESFDKFIKRYEKSKRKQLARATVHWGREGEIDYCLPLSELSAKERKSFVSQVRSLLRKSKLVHIDENVACRS